MKMFRIATCIIACCLLCWPTPSKAETDRNCLVIPGTGDSQLLLRALAAKFMQSHPGVTVDIPDSVGSSGGRKAVLDGKASLARVANASPVDEKCCGLRYRTFAYTPVVFAVNPSVTGVGNILPEQALGVYSGAITDWSELGGAPGKIYPLSREQGDSSLAVISRAIPGFKDLGSGVGKVYYTTPETLQALKKHPGTLAYGPLAMFSANETRVLTLSGLNPDPSGDNANAYPFVQPLGFVWKNEPGPLERSFMDFTKSPEAIAIIRQHACIPEAGE